MIYHQASFSLSRLVATVDYRLIGLSKELIHHRSPQASISTEINNDTGYPHDGRADNTAYRHDRRADKRRYPHDNPHDRDIDIQMLKMSRNGYILS